MTSTTISVLRERLIQHTPVTLLAAGAVVLGALLITHNRAQAARLDVPMVVAPAPARASTPSPSSLDVFNAAGKSVLVDQPEPEAHTGNSALAALADPYPSQASISP